MSARIRRAVVLVAGLVPLALAVLPVPARAQATGGRTVTWNSYLGGSAADAGFHASQDRLEGIITSRGGDSFVIGSTNAPRFPGSKDAPVSGTGSDILVTKLDADGGVVWTRVLGGEGDDIGRRIAFNHPNEEHLYITGTIASPTLRDRSILVRGTPGGDKDAFLARVELDGSIPWFLYLGGPGNQEAHDLVLFPDTRVAYVTGTNEGDVFVTQVNTVTGAEKWTAHFGSPSPLDVGFAVMTTPPFDVLYVGGRIGPGPLPVEPKNRYGGGSNDGFLARLNSVDGSIQFFKYVGGNLEDEVRDILYQPYPGGITLLGNTNSQDFPENDRGLGDNIFLIRSRDLDGTFAEQKLVGRGGEAMEGHASSDSKGNIYFGGKATAPDLAFKAFDPFFEPGDYQDDGFVAMVDPQLTRLVWASYVGGPTGEGEAVRGVSAVPLRQLTIIGSTHASSGVLVADAGADLTANGGEDGVIFRLPVDLNPPVAGHVTGWFEPDGRITGAWTGFRDDETDVNYTVELLENGFSVGLPQDVAYPATTFTFIHTRQTGSTYQVKVTARDLFDEAVSVTSGPVVGGPPDGGPSGNGPDAGGVDSGTPGPKPEDGDSPPLGWSCGSAGGGTVAGVIALMVLALLSQRRERPGSR